MQKLALRLEDRESASWVDDSDSESMLSDQSDLFCTQRSETKDKLYPAVAVKKLLQETKNIKRMNSESFFQDIQVV